MDKSEIDRYRANLQSEIDGVALYRALADNEQSPQLRQIFGQLADAEQNHAEIWRSKLRSLGEVPVELPGWRTRVLIWAARRFGAALVLPTVIGREQADSDRYRGQPDAVASGLNADERSHGRIFAAIRNGGSGGIGGGAIAQLEGRHRSAGGNSLRAAVLGLNDGLVSNASLVMGVVGADLAQRGILVTGFAGLLAGSLSMALGEWLSVQSARELFEHQLAIERMELETNPEEEAEELALIYQAKGIPTDQARDLAAHIIGDPTTALDTLAREELGVNPEELGGSAWVAAATSFILFSLGAIVPVIPFLFDGGNGAIGASLALSVLALFLTGAGITVITGKSALVSGSRQVAFGVVAAAITFGVGRLVGSAV